MYLDYKFDLYCWACDFSSNRGEGILARHYIQNLSKIKKKKFFVRSPDGIYTINKGVIKISKINLKNKSKLNFNLFENYLNPIVGVFYLWMNYCRGRGVCYLNFLPLWNTLLFIFLPPRTHLGPVTGFIYKKKVVGLNSFLRKYLNNFLFKLTLKILFLRQNKIYFSTNLLKPLISKNNKKKIYFNYLIHLVNIKEKSRKNIDFLIYNRNYSVKNNLLRNKLLRFLSKMNLKIFVVGDPLYLKKIKNLGFVSRNKINSLLKKTKYIINSGENPYNIFTIDSFNNHVNIIYEKTFVNKINFFNKQKLIFLDFKNENKITTFFNENNFKKLQYSILTKDYKILKNENNAYFNTVKIIYTNLENKTN
jgi:hypothetical protein